MEMHGQRALPISQQQAWDALNDPEILKACVPGCEKFEPTGEGQYSIGMTLKIGPVSAKFTGKVQLSEVTPPAGYTLSFDGQGGAAGFGKGSSKVNLTPTASGCDLSYTVNAQVGGKIAQLGQRLIDGAAKSMADDFFKRFETQMQLRHPAPEAPAEASPVATVTPLGTKSPIPVWVWVVGAVVLAGLVYFARR